MINMASTTDGHQIFNTLSTKFTQLLYGRTEGDRDIINKILDELNSLDYRHTIITNNTRAVLLVNQFCNLVPPDDSLLVAKCCTLITSLINRQQVAIEGRTLSVTIEWILQALKQAQGVSTVDILVTLDALLRSNTQLIYSLLPNIVTKNSILQSLTLKDKSPEIILFAVQCLEACCSIPNDYKLLNSEECHESYETCSKIFLKFLLMERNASFDELIYAKLLITCLNGIQNIIIQYEELLARDVGLFLGVIKSYMVYQLRGIDFLVPQKLHPSALSIPEPVNCKIREKKGGKVTRQRKQRLCGGRKENRKTDGVIELADSQFHVTESYHPGGTIPEVDPWSRLKTSDSEYSDSESGRSARVPIVEGRVRQASLNLLLHVCKLTHKRIIFSYWSSFIPDSPLSGSHSLTNCILKDPSPKGRMAALNVLLSLLASSKLYLSQAEYSDRVSSFTPFSVVLGTIIRELHHCLSLALNEVSYPVLIQALKCLAALVQATPYHRLMPGLTTKVIRNVKPFIYHKDATVQVAALIVLGCLLASEPIIKETREAFLKTNQPASDDKIKLNKTIADDDDIDYADFSSDDEEAVSNSEVPWPLHRCLQNLGIQFPFCKTMDVAAAPVKLESLLVISAMSRNYFEPLILPHLTHITKALNNSLMEKHCDVRLHGGRTVDFIGQAMNIHLMNADAKLSSIDRSAQFWLTLLNGALIHLVQCEQLPTLRTTGCDCLGSMGVHVFERLPRDKQFLCITLLFSASRDEDNAVKGAAVRALAICLLYPSLREDIGFIMDTAEAIHRTLKDDNISLRGKSSWSLGNLSDALVLNKADPNLEQVPRDTLLTLIQDSIDSCSDTDKIKSNAVRSVGNLLQLIDDELIAEDEFRVIVESAIGALVKCSSNGSNMKVRWNGCYALGNILKNNSLYTTGNTWLRSVVTTLIDLVVSFKNFKVRINAALALAGCQTRQQYGQHYATVWDALIKALENSENMEDFSEYKHRDHLIDQICLSLGHLTNLITLEDLVSIKDTFSENALKTHMQRVYDRLVPEKSSILFAASGHLLTLKATNAQQEEGIEMLKNIFSNEITF